jgi:EF hand domain-containing protein
MKLVKSVLVASAMALACGGAFAADKDKDAKGFNDMDKNADGKLTRAEAKGNKELLARWKEADTNNDGVLSRVEYLKLMAKVDANTVKEKVTGAPAAVKKETTEAKRRAPEASTGSTAPAGSGKPQ